MKVFALLLITLTLLGSLSLAKEANYNEAEQTASRQEWLDPWDMIHYDAAAQSLDRTHVTNGGAKDVTNKHPDYEKLQAKLAQCYKDLEKSPVQCQACAEKTVINASPCDTPYFKKLVRSILGNLEYRGDHEVVVSASKDDIATLEKFVKSDGGNVQDVCEVITGIVSNFKGKDNLYDFSQWDNSTLSYITKEAILILASLILVICAAILFETHTKLTWWTQLWGVLFLCFIVSIPWEWFHLYRKAFASKQAQMAKKDIPKQCLSDHELQPLESLTLWFQNAFTFSDDMCVKYQETLLVDPIWEISPSKAISATLASIIAQPFEQIAEAIGKSFRALFKEVPIQWQPFVFVAVIIIIIIAMFILSGLQVRLPFMTITTIPALPGNVQGNLQQLENHVQNVEAALQQLNNGARQRDAIDHAPLQDNINRQQEQILELLNAMNERQQRWEEIMRRPEPAIQGDNQPVEGALGPVEGGANSVGAEEERPERLPIMESPKLKVPVQSTDADTKFIVEDVGSSEHP